MLPGSLLVTGPADPPGVVDPRAGEPAFADESDAASEQEAAPMRVVFRCSGVPKGAWEKWSGGGTEPGQHVAKPEKQLSSESAEWL